MGEHARLEREGDLGVLVVDSQPLNLFDAEMVGDILAALDQTGVAGRSWCARRASTSRAAWM